MHSLLAAPPPTHRPRFESAKLIEQRIAVAAARDSGCYTHFVVNNVLETTVEEVRNIIEKERKTL